MASKVTRFTAKVSPLLAEVAPVVSASKEQSLANVRRVYKELQRYAPDVWEKFDLLDMPLPVFRAALKKQFTNNAALSDFRTIDRKVAECEMAMESCRKIYYNSAHIRNILFRENLEPQPKDFLSTFLRGKQ